MPAGNVKQEASTAKEISSLEALLRKLPPEDQKEAFRILYGDVPETIGIPADVQSYADERDFEVAAYKFHAATEQRRAARIVRVGVIQNKILKPTTDPVMDQYEAIADRTRLESAGRERAGRYTPEASGRALASAYRRAVGREDPA